MDFKNLRKELGQDEKGHGKKDFPYRPTFVEQKKVEPESDVDWEHILRRVSLFMGIFLAAISVYFSYDGFDNNIAGGNASYEWWVKIVGIVLAIAVTVLQFVFSSRYETLNVTLKLFGIASYAYSMWSNYQGITHMLQMERNMAIVATLFMDGVPEPLIAWALGASLRGDFVGNMLKSGGSLFKAIFIPKKNKGTYKYQYDVNDDIKTRLGK